jgi:Glycosyl transferase family 2
LRIEAATVCVGYGDFLAATLPENLPLVDDLVVVTAPDDDETRAVCRKHSVHHVLSDEFKRDGPFNKARLIRRALDQIGGRDWILHLDADIVLPRKLRRLVELAHLDERCIYGADRQNVVGWEAWNRLKATAGPWDNHAHENGHWFHPAYRPGCRWVSTLHGYVPIGFFQLFHGSALVDGGYHQRSYPVHHGDAARTDVQFALQWDRRQRLLVPELIVLHLESEKSPTGANWRGRTTARFGPMAADARHPAPAPKPKHHDHDHRHRHHHEHHHRKPPS